MKNDQGVVEKYFIEIKPYAQTLQPVPPKSGAKLKEFKRYKREAETYLVNQSKWDAAKKYCERMNCKFIIVTERTLKSLRLM